MDKKSHSSTDLHKNIFLIVASTWDIMFIIIILMYKIISIFPVSV